MPRRKIGLRADDHEPEEDMPVPELELEVEAELGLLMPHDAAPIRELMREALSQGRFSHYDFLKYDHWANVRRHLAVLQADVLLARVADNIRARKAADSE